MTRRPEDDPLDVQLAIDCARDPDCPDEPDVPGVVTSGIYHDHLPPAMRGRIEMDALASGRSFEDQLRHDLAISIRALEGRRARPQGTRDRRR